MTGAKDSAFTGPTNDGFASGLTKREHFAVMLMQGLSANAELAGFSNVKCAELAVEGADILIAELNKEVQPQSVGEPAVYPASFK